MGLFLLFGLIKPFNLIFLSKKLSQEVLQTAFHRSVGHFRLGNYAQGLEGKVEYIVSAYGSAHIVQTPAIGDG